MATKKEAMATIFTKFIDKFKKNAFMIDEHTPSTPSLSSSSSTYSSLIASSHKANAFSVVEDDLKIMNSNIVSLLINGVTGTSERAGGPAQPTHPLLARIGTYYFEMKGKRLRPAVVLLVAHAVNAGVTSASIPSSQHELAQIIEMIHTSSLLHDDVIDDALTRRDNPSANAAFSNKMAILAGDFLLARASISLARLHNYEVTELMSAVLGDLVEGEFMQLKAPPSSSSMATPSTFDHYIRKTYLKTASLIANGCRSAAVLAGASREVIDIATDYGKNLGLAFQIVDDLLDYTGTESSLGKPAGADLTLGLATAPVLYASEEFPLLTTLIQRKFKEEGDVPTARDLVSKSKGIERTRDLAEQYCNRAVDAVARLPPSPARDALITLTQTVLTRSR